MDDAFEEMLAAILVGFCGLLLVVTVKVLLADDGAVSQMVQKYFETVI